MLEALALVVLAACWLWLGWVIFRIDGFWSLPMPEPEPGVLPEPEPEPWVRPEPWRDTCPQAVELPVSLVACLVDPSEYAAAVGHRFRVDPLAEDIGVNGLREPVVVHMDAQGKTVLADGNHRLVAHVEQGWLLIPVEVRNVRLIRGFGVPARRFVDLLLNDRKEQF